MDFETWRQNIINELVADFENRLREMKATRLEQLEERLRVWSQKAIEINTDQFAEKLRAKGIVSDEDFAKAVERFRELETMRQADIALAMIDRARHEDYERIEQSIAEVRANYELAFALEKKGKIKE